jgi:hypothetical protein
VVQAVDEVVDLLFSDPWVGLPVHFSLRWHS